MKVILVKDIKGIGRGGQLKEVAEGYARNFLIPNGLAIVGTEDKIKLNQAEIKRAEEKLQSESKAAAEMLKKITKSVYEFELPGDKNGHLYAGLKESEILAKITEGGATLKNRVTLVDYSPIKTAGEHQIKVEALGVVKNVKISIKSTS